MLSIDQMQGFKSHLKINLKILLSAIAIMMVWRAVFGVLDHYFLPEHKNWAYLLAFIIGIVILLIDDWLLKELDENN